MSLFQAFENFVGPSIFISMLVSAIHPLTYPIVYRIEIMIGGYESSKFVGPLNMLVSNIEFFKSDRLDNLHTSCVLELPCQKLEEHIQNFLGNSNLGKWW